MNVGILGAGRIAITMANTINGMDDVNLYAVASRDLERAKCFAKELGVEKAYGSYDEMVQDRDIDLVYIATPHSHHLQHIKLAADYGKAILCEKAFTMNAAQAKEAYAYAKEKNVFLAEAMWVRYMPMTVTLKTILQEARIGDVVGLTANLGYAVMHKERLMKPELGGGALLDLGVYTLNFATTVLGDDVKMIESSAVMHETGVDRQEFVNLIYENGALASLYNTAQTITDRKGVIYGTKGYIVVDNINNYEAFRIYNHQHELLEMIERPEQITGFEYQVAACKRALLEGRTECEEMPHAHSIRIMQVIDDIRKQWVRVAESA